MILRVGWTLRKTCATRIGGVHLLPQEFVFLRLMAFAPLLPRPAAPCEFRNSAILSHLTGQNLRSACSRLRYSFSLLCRVRMLRPSSLAARVLLPPI